MGDLGFWPGFFIGFFTPWVLSTVALVVIAVVKVVKDRRPRRPEDGAATREDVRQ